MKKMIAVLSAAVLCCGALTAPVFAEEEPAKEYMLGDVNTDGIIDSNDAMIALQCYVKSMIGVSPYERVTEEQYKLAKVCHNDFRYTVCGYITDENGGKILDKEHPFEIADPVTCDDAQLILQYYALNLAGKDVGTLEDYAANRMDYDLSEIELPE